MSGISALIMMCPFVLLWKVVQEVLKGITDISEINARRSNKVWTMGSSYSGRRICCIFCSMVLYSSFYTAFNMKSKALKHMSELP